MDIILNMSISASEKFSWDSDLSLSDYHICVFFTKPHNFLAKVSIVHFLPHSYFFITLEYRDLNFH